MRLLPGLILAGLIAADHLSACSCRLANLCERAGNASVIFVGQLLDGGFESPETDPWSGLASTARFRVVERFRGLPGGLEEVEVDLFFWKGMCSAAPYFNGRTYLVFTSRDERGKLRDGLCTSSRDVESAKDELEYLRRYFGGQTSTAIRGRIAGNPRSNSIDFAIDHGYAKPVAGARVVAERGARRFEGVSDAEGRYEIAGLEAGVYTITAHHDSYASPKPAYGVTVSEGGCAIHNVGLSSTNFLEGNVFDSEGQPVRNAAVTLLAAETESSKANCSTLTDGSGRFAFNQITPGEYVLAVNPRGMSVRMPYEPRFYDGTADREAATTITITPQSGLFGYVLVLGKRHPTRRIVAQIKRSDGSPASGVGINCTLADAGENQPSGTSGTSNEAGEASCTGFADHPYTLSISDRANEASQHKFLVPPGPTDVRIQVELPKPDSESGRPNQPKIP